MKIAISEMDTGGKIPPGDPRWATFNDSFRNLELDPIDFIGHVYSGHSYTTWHEGRRKLDNFMLAQHIAIDLDTEDARSTIRFLETLPLVRMYAGFIHTTPSHKPDTPRCRVVFYLDQPITTGEGYSEAVRVLVHQFPGADESCTDASRFFYGAKDCDTWLNPSLDATLPLSHIRRMWHVYRRKFPQRNNNVISLVERRMARQIVKGAQGEQSDDLTKASEALRKIDPWGISYNDWIGLIAAMKRDLGDAAMPAVVAWADGKPGEVEREWDRLRTERSGGATLGKVFYMAGKVGR